MSEKIVDTILATIGVALTLGLLGYCCLPWFFDPCTWIVLACFATGALSVYLVYFWADTPWQMWVAYLFASLVPVAVLCLSKRLFF